MFSLIDRFYSHRATIWYLAKNDIRARYLGSVFGSLWIFLLPLLNLFIMWFAFEHGLKPGKQNGVPFILWLVTGVFPWTFFSDAVSSSASSVVEKSFLVKKVVFDVELLPLIKVSASMVLFSFLSVVMLLLFLLYGYYPSIYWLQIPYFAVCLGALVMSLSWFTSAIVVFYRDLGQIISVGIQIGFWATPIFWSPALMPENLKIFISLNPMSYVIGGYRKSLISNEWFWSDPGQTIYFWSFVGLLSMFGIIVFRRLRPHFADLL